MGRTETRLLLGERAGPVKDVCGGGIKEEIRQSDCVGEDRNPLSEIGRGFQNKRLADFASDFEEIAV